MDFQIVYWHWLVLGVILIIGEIFIPSFTILWFGLGAILVGLVLTLVDLHITTQLWLWTLSAITFTVIWFRLIKPRVSDRNDSELAKRSSVGESGLVIKLPTDTTNGKLRFSTPILDCEEWEFVCNSQVKLGDRLYVEKISGNHLVVVKAD
jgi:membrane protein implicated in regulation of membrane protease activity